MAMTPRARKGEAAQPKRRTRDGSTARRGVRIGYGVNVVASVVLALVIVVLINWLSYRTLRDKRIDMTAFGQYTLSDQTRRVLDDLDGEHRLVAILTPGSEAADRTIDLVAEYEWASPLIKAEHIDPSTQEARLDAFERQLHARFASDLKPLDDALARARDALADADALASTLIEQLDDVLSEPVFRNATRGTPGFSLIERIRQALGSIAGALVDWRGELQRKTRPSLDTAMSGPLPDPLQAVKQVQASLGRFVNITEQLQNWAPRAMEGVQPEPYRAKELLGDLARLIEQRNAGLIEVERRLAGATATAEAEDSPVRTYGRLIGQLGRPNVVVVIGPSRIEAVSLDAMERRLREQDQPAAGSGPAGGTDAANAADRAAVEYLGEERISGALIRMQMHQAPPRVVFVSLSATDPLGDSPLRLATYNRVASRLRELGFQTLSWTPLRQLSGRPLDEPPPADEPGRETVWIVIPDASKTPSVDPIYLANTQPVAAHIRARLAAGDGAMIMMLAGEPTPLGDDAGGPGTAMGGQGRADDPWVALAEAWGVSVRTDRGVFVERGPGRRGLPHLHRIDQWPDDLPITRALAGMDAIFGLAMPVTLGDADLPGVTHHPLVVIEGPDLRLDGRFFAYDAAVKRQGPAITFDPSTGAPSFTVAVASESPMPAADRGASAVAQGEDGRADDAATVEPASSGEDGSGDAASTSAKQTPIGPGARLVVVGDADWACDYWTGLGRLGMDADRTGARFPANAELFVNAVCWLAGKEQLIAASAQARAIPRIEPMGESWLTAWRYVLLVGMPLAYLVLGVVVWSVRRLGA